MKVDKKAAELALKNDLADLLKVHEELVRGDTSLRKKVENSSSLQNALKHLDRAADTAKQEQKRKHDFNGGEPPSPSTNIIIRPGSHLRRKEKQDREAEQQRKEHEEENRRRALLPDNNNKKKTSRKKKKTDSFVFVDEEVVEKQDDDDFLEMDTGLAKVSKKKAKKSSSKSASVDDTGFAKGSSRKKEAFASGVPASPASPASQEEDDEELFGFDSGLAGETSSQKKKKKKKNKSASLSEEDSSEASSDSDSDFGAKRKPKKKRKSASKKSVSPPKRAHLAEEEVDEDYEVGEPRAVESIRKYKMGSDALVWVHVGPFFNIDRPKPYQKRPGYVMCSQEMEDLEVGEQVGGANIKMVRLFVDKAPPPWNVPNDVKGSLLVRFGGGKQWDKDKVAALKRGVSTAEFKHAVTLGANKALEIALENDIAAGTRDSKGRKITLKKDEQQQQSQIRCDDSDEEGVNFMKDDDQTGEGARIDRAREALLERCPGVEARSPLYNKLETLFDLLLQPTLYEYRGIRKHLQDDPPLDKIGEALDAVESVVDAELLAKCRATLEQMRDGTLLTAFRALERPD